MRSETLSKRTESKILILGKGYVGTNLMKHLSKKFDDVYLMGSSDLNYHDSHELTKFLLNANIRTVINCSGFTGRPNVDEAESRKEECWRLNVTSPLAVNQACNRVDVRYIHISSGCIYTGYDHWFNETDKPNFGLFDDSSFYSKTKHAFELMSRHLSNKIIRVRMPICNDLDNPRNYLKKIMEYPNLINYVNSKTYLPELCGFIEALLKSDVLWRGQDIYNVVNGGPLSTTSVVDHLNRMNEGNWKMLNPKWVGIEDLKITAPRSNCVLDNSKALCIYPLSDETTIMNMVCNYNTTKE